MAENFLPVHSVKQRSAASVVLVMRRVRGPTWGESYFRAFSTDYACYFKKFISSNLFLTKD